MPYKPTGGKPGRPPKAPLSDEEALLVVGLMREGYGRMHGNGIRAAAKRINEERSPGDQVSPAWVYEAVRAWMVRQQDHAKRSETPTTAPPPVGPDAAPAPPTQAQEAFRNPNPEA